MWTFMLIEENVILLDAIPGVVVTEVVLPPGNEKTFPGTEFLLSPLDAAPDVDDAVMVQAGRFTVRCPETFNIRDAKDSTKTRILHPEPGSLEIDIEDAPGTRSPRLLSEDRLPSVPGISWGKMAGGIMAGIAIEGSTDRFKPGESVSSTVYVRNITDTELGIVYPDHPAWDWNPRIFDTQGKEQEVRYAPTFHWRVQITARIMPGEIIAIGQPVFVLGSSLDARAEGGKPAIFVASVGEYRFQFPLSLRHTGSRTSKAFISIVTGQVSFSVTR